MTDAVQIELIRAIPTCIGSIGAVFAAWFSYKSSGHSKEAVQVAKNTERNTNGAMDKLIALTEKSSHAQGVLEERTREAKTHEDETLS